MIPLLLTLTAPARAQDAVLWYEGDDGYSTNVVTMTSWLRSAGASRVDDTTSFPASLSDYRLIFMVSPRDAPSTTTRAALRTWVAGGGTLVLIAENSNSFADSIAVMNVLAGDHGASSTFTAATLDAACNWSASSTDAHYLVRGLGGVDYGGTCALSLGGDAVELLVGESGQTLLALDGGVVLATDANLFNDSCSPNSENRQLIENLFGGLCDDADQDGFFDLACGGDDCDDGAPGTHPGAAETWYDGVDADCAGDDDFDADADGWGSADHGGEDCDDQDPAVNPEAEETWYDGVDQDCAGDDDDDADGDGWPVAEDCDEADPSVHPEAEETWYDGVDQDCAEDDDFDADGDGWDAEAWGGQDCLDLDPTVNPDGVEVCDGLDNDCDGEVDDAAQDAPVWYADLDGDGYGDPETGLVACEAPTGMVADGTDCAPDDPLLYPLAEGYDEACEPVYIKLCACASGPAEAGAWWWLLGALVGWRRRRATPRSPAGAPSAARG
ncbi:MAG: hypothetical protein H6741_32460 [Alphaproteobacteria bacterium]|nr:hypothetical protein [Alphaproteobacteria bacterium]MCB9797428.1 hypothetical protein [Alphaproteobacteria bacterium]